RICSRPWPPSSPATSSSSATRRITGPATARPSPRLSVNSPTPQPPIWKSPPMSQHVTRRIRVLVKAFPQPSAKHEETVCCAGVCEDTGELLRLFPIRYRRLDAANRFNRYDLVSITVTKASDPRPESYRVDEGSIRLLERGKGLSDQQKVKLWQPFIAPSLTALEDDNKNSHRSLGIIRPDPDSLVFKVKPVAEADEDEQEVTNLVYQQQASLLEEPLTPLASPEVHFGYEFRSDGHQHWRTIQDW